MKPLRIAALTLVFVGSHLGAQNPEKPFPEHWGDPPAVQTFDYRDLPGGYGKGSSTMAHWITENMKKDEAQGAPSPEPEKKPFPKHWGQPPQIQTSDYGDLPNGYGKGSSTLANWIRENLKKDEAKMADGKPKSDGDEKPQAPEKATPFPAHWGEPPKIQTRDLRDLPGGYGKGSSTLAKWITENMKKDATTEPGPLKPADPDFAEPPPSAPQPPTTPSKPD